MAFRHNVLYKEALDALREYTDMATLGVDQGNAQSTATLNVPNCCTHRFAVDAAGNTNLISALAVITWKNPFTGDWVKTTFVSNYLAQYEALRTLAAMPEADFERHMGIAEWINLLLDLLLTMAVDCTGDTVYIPLPEGCGPWAQEAMQSLLERMLKGVLHSGREYRFILMGIEKVQCVPGQFSEIFQDFKRAPDQWQEKPYDESPYRYCDLMQLYFAALMRCLVRMNGRVFCCLCGYPDKEKNMEYFLRVLLRDQRSVTLGECGNPVLYAASKRADPSFHLQMLLAIQGKDPLFDMISNKKQAFRLVVGCPAYPEWTDEQNRRRYSRLLLRALQQMGFAKVKKGIGIGVPLEDEEIEALGSGPAIYPEPSAAILPHLTGSRQDKPDLTMGVMIVDSGALTHDVCFMYYSEHKTYRFNCSTDTFGGARIEWNMLEILKERVKNARFQQGLDTAFDLAENASLLLYLRMVKEGFYPQCQDMEISVHFHLSDGSLAVQRFHTAELIHQALNRKYRVGSENRDQKKSWLERAEAFKEHAIAAFRTYTGLSDLKVGSLILTGGTSSVQELRDILKDPEVFARIEKEEDPSGCVGNGLALTISSQELDAFFKHVLDSKVLSGSEQKLTQSIKTVMGEYLPQIVIDHALWCIQKGRIVQVKTFGEEVSALLDEDERINRKMQDQIALFAAGCAEQICQYLNDHETEYFAGRLPVYSGKVLNPQLYTTQISGDVTHQMTGVLDLRSVMGKIAAALKKVVKFAALAAIPVIGPILALIYLGEENSEDMTEEEIRRQQEMLMGKKEYKRIINQMKNAKKSKELIDSAVDKLACEGRLFRDMSRPIAEKMVARATMTTFDVDWQGQRIDS